MTKKLLLYNGAYGLGAIGDDAILAGVLNILHGRDFDITVGAYDKTSLPWVKEKVINWNEITLDYDIWTLWGGGILYPEHISSMLPAIRQAIEHDKYVCVRGVGIGSDEDTLVPFKDIANCHVFTVRSRISQTKLYKAWGLRFALEEDPILYCPEEDEEWDIPQGSIGIQLSELIDLRKYLDSNIVNNAYGIVSTKHLIANINDADYLKANGITNIIYEPNPMKFKHMLRKFSYIYTQKKHTGAMAYYIGTPVSYYGINPLIHEIIDSWGIKYEKWIE